MAQIILSKCSAQPLVAMASKLVDLNALVRNPENKSQSTPVPARLSQKNSDVVSRNIVLLPGGRTSGLR